MLTTNEIETRLAELGCWRGQRGEWVIAWCAESYYQHGVSCRFENLGHHVWQASDYTREDCASQPIDSQQVIPAVERLIATRGTPINRDIVEQWVANVAGE